MRTGEEKQKDASDAGVGDSNWGLVGLQCLMKEWEKTFPKKKPLMEKKKNIYLKRKARGTNGGSTRGTMKREFFKSS